MERERCPHCGELHVAAFLGQHIEQCKEENPDPKYSIKNLEERITKLEEAVKGDCY